MKNASNWIILIVLMILIAGGVILALPKKSSGPDSSVSTSNDQTVKNDEALIYRDGAAQIGPSDAKVKLVVFSDYLCPYCKTLHESLKTILAKYPNDLVVYHRTFIIHNDAVIMAKAVEAANKQGKFAEADDAIFEKYQTGNQTAMDSMAQSIGLSLDQFNTDLSGSDIQKIIDVDNADATDLNLQGTPSVFLNGAFVEDPGTLSSQIDSLLK